MKNQFVNCRSNLLFTLSVSSNDDNQNLNTNLTGLGDKRRVEKCREWCLWNNDGVGNCFMMSDVKMEAGSLLDILQRFL